MPAKFGAIQLMQEDSTTIATPKRADALDALRGFAILAMVFSGTIRYQILPAWMYHAQEPPPTHTYSAAIAGLTWVDVVFPLFLFSMGAAIPLALSRRLAQGWNIAQMVGYIVKRGLLLGAFAIVLQHLRPFAINPTPTSTTWLIALLGFVLLFLMFGRWSSSWKLKKYGTLLTLSGWLAAVILLSQLQYAGKGFSLSRSDPILIALANMASFGSLIWLLTRSNWFLRLGLLGCLIALQFSSGSEGWVKGIWGASPVPWIFQFYYLKYLFIVIPGTIAGDLILTWTQQKRLEAENLADEAARQGKTSQASQRSILIIGSMLALCIVLLIGLQARWIWQTTILCAILCIATSLLFAKPENPTESLIKQFYQWGVYWLFLGLCFEPFQGGIHKDPSTYSYYFVTTAIALFLLIIFTVLIELNQRKKIQLFIENGQNPMIAYVAFANLVWPILQLTGIESQIINYTGTPIMGVIKGIIYTLPIALLTSFLTRRKLVWRA